MRKCVLLCTCLLLAGQGAAMADIVENFDDVAALLAAGQWSVRNVSSPKGLDWFQGNDGVFQAYQGAPNSYIAANYLSADPNGGDIDNWLFTPVISLDVPTLITFYTRGDRAGLADRMELRLSTQDASTNVADFGTLLLTINPALIPDGYPDTWTKVGAEIASPFGAGTTGRFAFRYVVPDNLNNGDYIGIDTVSITSQVPEPMGMGCAAVLLTGLALLKRKKR